MSSLDIRITTIHPASHSIGGQMGDKVGILNFRESGKPRQPLGAPGRTRTNTPLPATDLSPGNETGTSRVGPDGARRSIGPRGGNARLDRLKPANSGPRRGGNGEGDKAKRIVVAFIDHLIRSLRNSGPQWPSFEVNEGLWWILGGALRDNGPRQPSGPSMARGNGEGQVRF